MFYVVLAITFEQSSKPSFTINYNKNIVYFISVIRWLECVCACQSSRLKASYNSLPMSFSTNDEYWDIELLYENNQ